MSALPQAALSHAASVKAYEHLPITGRSSPFVNWLGLRRIDLKEGRSLLGLTPTEHHINAHDIVQRLVERSR